MMSLNFLDTHCMLNPVITVIIVTIIDTRGKLHPVGTCGLFYIVAQCLPAVPQMHLPPKRAPRGRH